jgi:hypothetical protein
MDVSGITTLGVSGKLQTEKSCRVHVALTHLAATDRVSSSNDLPTPKRRQPALAVPILFGFALYRWRLRILDLQPVIDAARTTW